MKETLLISPHFPPQTTGLAGHTQKLLKNLEAIGLNPTLLTHSKIPTPWGPSSLKKILKESLGPQYQFIFLQYTPGLWGLRAGLNIAPALFMLIMRIFSNKKLLVYFHEVENPAGGTFRTFFIHAFQRLMSYIVLHSSHRALASCHFIEEQLLRLGASSQNLLLLPVGSNIDFSPLSALEKKLLKNKTAEGKKILCLFGAFHEARRIYEFLEYGQDLLEKNSYHLLFIGNSEEQIKKECSLETWNKIKNNLTATGIVDDQSVSHFLQISDGLLAFFEDGASLRRGTIMAALSHQLPILTTYGQFTDPELLSLPLIQTTPPHMKSFILAIPSFLQRKIPPSSLFPFHDEAIRLKLKTIF